MLRQSAMLFFGYLLAHILNSVYQMVVSRVLPQNEYALLAAFLGALLILQYPLMTLTTGLSHFSSLMAQHDLLQNVRPLLLRWIWRTGIAGLGLAAIGILFRNQIIDAMHISRTGPVIVSALSLPAFFMLPIVLGVSQGIQKFGWNTATTVAGSITRLAAGSFCVLLVFPSSGWGLLGHGLGTTLNMLALLAGLLWILPRKSNDSHRVELPKLRFFLLQSGLVQIAYATLMTADVILIKHFLPNEMNFAYAATLGRLVVFLSSTIVIAMFPKVTSDGPITPKQFDIFKQSLFFTAICAIMAVLGCALFPRLLLGILYGINEPSRNLIMMTIAMAAIMSISALLNTCLQFLVAQKRFYATIWVPAAALAYLTLSWFQHTNAWQMILWAGLANTAALIPLAWLCWHPDPASRHQLSQSVNSGATNSN